MTYSPTLWALDGRGEKRSTKTKFGGGWVSEFGRKPKAIAEDASRAWRGRRGTPRLYLNFVFRLNSVRERTVGHWPNDLSTSIFCSSLSRMIGPSCDTFPAPMVRIMSPGWDRAATAAEASTNDAIWIASRLPFVAICRARVSAVTPSMGFSLAA